MNKQSSDWLSLAEYDLQTAQAMLDSGRYLYVIFMCQQSIEKILKAIYAYKKNEIPPRTHNLLYLIDVLEISMSEIDKKLLGELNQFYLGGRYPGKINELAKAMDHGKAIYYLDKTREVWQCLKQMLP